MRKKAGEGEGWAGSTERERAKGRETKEIGMREKELLELFNR